MTGTRQSLSRETLAAIAQAGERGQYCDCLSRISREIGATHYLLISGCHERGGEKAHVIASNWAYDTIVLAGPAGLARIAEGTRHPLGGDGERAGGDAREIARAHGHQELFPLPLRTGSRRCHVLFSSAKEGAIDAALLPLAQLSCCYLVSRLPGGLFGESTPDALSERERECLFWVSEGKTTGEVAVILGVTPNTVNSYLAHAIQKFGASNRAMAIATAIRTGTI